MLISLIVVLTTITVCAQVQTDENTSIASDTTHVYRLFPTQNMWIFIKLNTRTGQMWLVQWSIDDDDSRFETYLSLRSLVPEEEEVNGRFTLYSTTNMYNFILLDQIDGRTWQAQWSTKAENRFIIPIE